MGASLRTGQKALPAERERDGESLLATVAGPNAKSDHIMALTPGKLI
jgi:hypothetical protein